MPKSHASHDREATTTSRPVTRVPFSRCWFSPSYKVLLLVLHHQHRIANTSRMKKCFSFLMSLPDATSNLLTGLMLKFYSKRKRNHVQQCPLFFTLTNESLTFRFPIFFFVSCNSTQFNISIFRLCYDRERE